DRAQTTRARLADDRTLGNRLQRVIVERQLHIFHLEEALILPHERVLRLGQDVHEGLLVEVLKRRDNWQAADELRDQAKLEEVLRLDPLEDVAGAAIIFRTHISAEADRRTAAAVRDDLLEAGKRAPADEEDVRRVDLQEFLLRMLAAALRRNG